MPRAILASTMAWLVGPTSPATIASGCFVQDAAVSAASSSTDRYIPTSRIANCGGWTPTASPPALERPFDGPAGVGEVFEKFAMFVHDIDQDRARCGLRDRFNQRGGRADIIGEQWPELPRGATAADQAPCVAMRNELRAGTSG